MPAKKVGDEYYVTPDDSPNGFVVNGTLATDEAVGVHSLTDVPVYAWGPCQDTFGGTYGNVDIFYKIASCLGLATHEAGEPPVPGNPDGHSTSSGGVNPTSVNPDPVGSSTKQPGACAAPTKQ